MTIIPARLYLATRALEVYKETDRRGLPYSNLYGQICRVRFLSSNGWA